MKEVEDRLERQGNLAWNADESKEKERERDREGPVRGKKKEAKVVVFELLKKGIGRKSSRARPFDI